MEFIAKYVPDKNNKKKVRIFGKNFVKKNKDKCLIIFGNKKFELTEYFENILSNYDHKAIVLIKIRITNENIDLSYMFDDCTFLE